MWVVRVAGGPLTDVVATSLTRLGAGLKAWRYRRTHPSHSTVVEWRRWS